MPLRSLRLKIRGEHWGGLQSPTASPAAEWKGVEVLLLRLLLILIRHLRGGEEVFPCARRRTPDDISPTHPFFLPSGI